MCEGNMRRIGLAELKRNYEERKPSRIVYNTDNNRTQMKDGTLKECMEIVKPKCELTFDKLIVILQPDAVGLTGPGGAIAFWGVEAVWLESYDAWNMVYLKCRECNTIFGLLFDY